MDTFSTTHSGLGWRVGYAFGSAQLIRGGLEEIILTEPDNPTPTLAAYLGGLTPTILATATAPPGATGYGRTLHVQGDLGGAGAGEEVLVGAPAPGIPTFIDPGTTVTFAFQVDVSGTATPVLVVLDGWVTATDAYDGAPASVSGALVQDQWTVHTGGEFRIDQVDTAPLQVVRGQSGITVTGTITNIGQTDINVAPFPQHGLTFTDAALLNRGGEDTVTADPGNPLLIAVGATRTFNFLVDVSATAWTGLVTIQVENHGVDVATAGGATPVILSDLEVDTPDQWDVQASCLAPLCVDCDLNTLITVLDALKAAQIGVGFIVYSSLSLLEQEQCDVDNDGDADVLDALRLAQYAVSLPVALICC